MPEAPSTATSLPELQAARERWRSDYGALIDRATRTRRRHAVVGYLLGGAWFLLCAAALGALARESGLIDDGLTRRSFAEVIYVLVASILGIGTTLLMAESPSLHRFLAVVLGDPDRLDQKIADLMEKDLRLTDAVATARVEKGRTPTDHGH